MLCWDFESPVLSIVVALQNSKQEIVGAKEAALTRDDINEFTIDKELGKYFYIMK